MALPQPTIPRALSALGFASAMLAAAPAFAQKPFGVDPVAPQPPAPGEPSKRSWHATGSSDGRGCFSRLRSRRVTPT